MTAWESFLRILTRQGFSCPPELVVTAVRWKDLPLRNHASEATRVRQATESEASERCTPEASQSLFCAPRMRYALVAFSHARDAAR